MDLQLRRRASSVTMIAAWVAVIFAAGYWIVTKDTDLPFQITLIIGAVALAASILFDPDSVRIALTGRQARFGSNAAIMILAVLGCVVLANVLAHQYDQRWDLSEGQLNSLAPETVEILERLPEKVNAQAFFTQRSDPTAVKRLLDRLAEAGDGKFTYEVLDPEADLVAAQQAGIERDGDIVLWLGDGSRRERVASATEDAFAEAFVRLMGEGVQSVYFLIGHNEHSLDASTDDAYTQVKALLENRNYVVQTMNLLTTGGVPADAAVVVVAGPLDPLMATEIEAIQSYLDGGGALVALAEPTLVMQLGDAPDLLSEYLAAEWGIALQDNLVVDLIGQQELDSPLMAVGAQFGAHAITADLTSSAVLMPSARSIGLVAAENISPVLLVSTSSDAWGETDLAGLAQGGEVVQDANDPVGPLWLGAAAESYITGARVVVFGDSDFIADAMITLTYGSNYELFTNAVDWAAGQENLISLSTGTRPTRTLRFETLENLSGWIFLFAVILLPLGVLGVGIWTVMRRRRQAA